MTLPEKQLVSLFNNYLRPRGWDRSLELGPVDAAEAPLPWITYPAQTVLKQIVEKKSRVFEFGCGNSSLWWASLSQEVVSVDHDETWIAKVSERKPTNLTLISRPRNTPPSDTLPTSIAAAIAIMVRDQVLSENDQHNVAHGLNIDGFIGYATALTEWPQGYFDIIIVDGMARALCAYLAGLWVKPNGIVVFDNSDRWQYSIGLEALRDLAFGRIDFFGAGPSNTYEWCTSIFARSMAPFLAIPPREKLKSDLGW
jgi:hypothetical protein